MGLGMNLGDMIDNSFPFILNSVYLKIGEEGENWDCSGSWIPRYWIPVLLKTIDYQDGIFGWIKVSGVSTTSITIESYALNLATTTAINRRMIACFSIHPNPTDKGFITLSLDNAYKGSFLTCFNT